MKQSQNVPSIFAKFMAVITLCFVQAVVWAQDGGLDVDVDLDKGGGDWYANPIVWIIAGAVFILLLVALLRGGSKDV